MCLNSTCLAKSILAAIRSILDGFVVTAWTGPVPRGPGLKPKTLSIKWLHAPDRVRVSRLFATDEPGSWGKASRFDVPPTRAALYGNEVQIARGCERPEGTPDRPDQEANSWTFSIPREVADGSGHQLRVLLTPGRSGKERELSLRDEVHVTELPTSTSRAVHFCVDFPSATGAVAFEATLLSERLGWIGLAKWPK